MKSSKLQALLGLYIFFLAVGVVQSCCTETYRIISAGPIMAFEASGQNNAPLDTIRGAFKLEAEFPAEFVTAFANTGFVNSAYATSCATNFLNALNESSFSLSIDHPIIYESDTLVPGDNLLDLDIVESSFQSNWGYITITFPEEFFRKVEIENALYQFRLSGETTDGMPLDSQLDIFVRL